MGTENFAVGMTTAPRQVSTIREAMMAARLNGWDPVVFAEPHSDIDGLDGNIISHTQKQGLFFNWIGCCRWLLDHNPDTEWIVTMQDDCVLMPNARKVVERFVPRWPEDCGLLSLYLPSRLTPSKKPNPEPGIRAVTETNFYGSLAVVYRRRTLEAILDHRIVNDWPNGQHPTKVINDDICVGMTVHRLRMKLYYTFPSCSQHISPYSTRLHAGAATGYRAANWVAEDALRDVLGNEILETLHVPPDRECLRRS